MGNYDYIAFSKEMKETHTILIPNMLPMHFRFIAEALRQDGFKCELMDTKGPQIVETGLKYVHNDACYPALLVIGQAINALQSGRYDPHKCAVVYFQTGGGCRASNYVSLMRKAFEKAGFGYVPVIAFSFMGIEKHPGFHLSAKTLARMAYGVIYGDVLMSLVNQVSPYEIEKGAAERLARDLTDRLCVQNGAARSARHGFKENIADIVEAFRMVPVDRSKKKVQVGVVGEIYIKYSPLGNNDLVQFLVNEGAEVTVPGLMDFMLFYLCHHVVERDLYGGHFARTQVFKLAYNLCLRIQSKVAAYLEQDGTFRGPRPFPHTVKRIQEYMHLGCKMGEGWLLPAEMLELYDMGVKNVVCAQPFGCLPNHICGKGMIKPFKDAYPDMNIVSVDYDPGATRVNQENRLKLMLANAADNLEQ